MCWTSIPEAAGTGNFRRRTGNFSGPEGKFTSWNKGIALVAKLELLRAY
jgi:hypothetical protein